MSAELETLTTNPDCPFCRIAAGSAAAEVVFRSAEVVVFMPDEPATAGHLLVVPRAHIPDVWSLEPAVARALGDVVLSTANALRDMVDLDGLNIIQSNGSAATQTVFHLHVHVLPRYVGDRVGEFWPEGPSIDSDAKRELAAQLETRMNAGGR
jgi:histidine triad (HIT) family protein